MGYARRRRKILAVAADAAAVVIIFIDGCRKLLAGAPLGRAHALRGAARDADAAAAAEGGRWARLIPQLFGGRGR